MQADQSARHPDTVQTPAAESIRPVFEPDQQMPAQASIAAQQLFQGSQEILINHNGDIYRLRITKNDKLILTK